MTSITNSHKMITDKKGVSGMIREAETIISRMGRGLFDSLKGSQSQARISRVPANPLLQQYPPRGPLQRMGGSNNQMLLSGSNIRNVVQNDVFEN